MNTRETSCSCEADEEQRARKASSAASALASCFAPDPGSNKQCLDPARCEGAHPEDGDPTTWSSWLSVPEAWVETWLDRRGVLCSERHSRRPRRFCAGGTCAARWIDARAGEYTRRVSSADAEREAA